MKKGLLILLLALPVLGLCSCDDSGGGGLDRFEIDDIVMPTGTITAGDQITIGGVGFLSSDVIKGWKSVVGNPGQTADFTVGVTNATPVSVKVTIPETVPTAIYEVYAYRSGLYCSLGGLSIKAKPEED